MQRPAARRWPPPPRPRTPRTRRRPDSSSSPSSSSTARTSARRRPCGASRRVLVERLALLVEVVAEVVGELGDGLLRAPPGSRRTSRRRRSSRARPRPRRAGARRGRPGTPARGRRRCGRGSRWWRRRPARPGPATASGERSFWLSVLTSRSPRASVRWVSASRSEPNCANASRSRYCESSSFRRPATFFIGAICAVAAHARHRDADVDGRAHAGVEELRLEEDLAVGDRDDVRRDVGRHVAGLRLDDRQRGQRAAAEVVVELDARSSRRRVQVEDVARVGLATRRAAQQQRHLAVGVGVLGEVVVDARARGRRCRGSTRPSRSRRRAPGT